MATPNKRNPQKLVTNTLVVLVFGYAIFLVGSSVYSDYQVKKQITDENAQIATLERNQTNLQFALLYYQSNVFKEVEARQYLLLKGADEHVVALPNAKTPLSLDVISPMVQAQIRQKLPTVTPVRAWWDLFFGNKS